MSVARRPWLTWTPPVLVAVVVVLALWASGSGRTSASPSTTEGSGPAPSAAGPGETTPTTAFFERRPILPPEPYDYGMDLPPHVESGALPGPLHQPLSALDATPPDAPVTDDGATLGRVLFYDVNLSANRTVRCASCHVQANSFTDPLMFSQGVGGFRTRRNSMSLANARFNPSGRYLWDEKAIDLETQVLMPFVNQLEMGLNEDVLLQRVEEQDYYADLFIAAFGDRTVTPDRIAGALAQFIRAMVSLDSAYDTARAEVADPFVSFPSFTDAENEGKRLFFAPIADGGAGCASCHTSEAQVDSTAGLRNNGLDPPTTTFVPPDLGAFEITGDPADAGRFRVPSLRNVEVTGPYMHDGRLASLEAVIDHYDSGVQPHENLSDELRDPSGAPVRLGLDADERAALVAFLRTLTDPTFLTDERFSEPFRAP